MSTECLFLAVKLRLFSMTTVCGQPPLQDGWWSCMVYYLFVSSVRRMWVMSWPKGDKNTVNIIAEPGERKRAGWHHRSLSEEFTVLTKDREKASLTLTQSTSLVTWWLKWFKLDFSCFIISQNKSFISVHIRQHIHWHLCGHLIWADVSDWLYWQLLRLLYTDRRI